jgi:hypothetical protein
MIQDGQNTLLGSLNLFPCEPLTAPIETSEVFKTSEVCSSPARAPLDRDGQAPLQGLRKTTGWAILRFPLRGRCAVLDL